MSGLCRDYVGKGRISDKINLLKTSVMLKFCIMKPNQTTRPPTRKSVLKATYTPPTFSCGKNELELMRYIQNCKKEYPFKFVVRHYALNVAKIPKTTVYDLLSRLRAKGLITDEQDKFVKGSPNWWATELTEKGIKYLESGNNCVGTPRRICREEGAGARLSTHKSDYVMQIKQLDFGAFDNLNNLRPLEHKKPNWKNNPQHHLHFEGITISVFTSKVIFRVHDILSDNTGQNEYEAFLKVCEYADKLQKIGITGDSISLQSAHYANIDSYLAGFLQKIDGRYSLELSDGSKIWIDYSEPNGLEDETDKKENRKRVDEFMEDMILRSDSKMSDVDQLFKDIETQKMITSDLIQVSANLIKLHMLGNPTHDFQSLTKDKPNYFG